MKFNIILSFYSSDQEAFCYLWTSDECLAGSLQTAKRTEMARSVLEKLLSSIFTLLPFRSMALAPSSKQ
jgi:hypothetical protein